MAGFNQFFEDFTDSKAWTYGVALDQTLSEHWFGGLQFFYRDLQVPYRTVNAAGETALVEDDWQEYIGSAYVYWAPLVWTTLGLEYYYERYSHDQYEGLKEIKNLLTHRLTPTISFFHPSGVSAKGTRWAAGDRSRCRKLQSRIRQHGSFTGRR